MIILTKVLAAKGNFSRVEECNRAASVSPTGVRSSGAHRLLVGNRGSEYLVNSQLRMANPADMRGTVVLRLSKPRRERYL